MWWIIRLISEQQRYFTLLKVIVVGLVVFNRDQATGIVIEYSRNITIFLRLLHQWSSLSFFRIHPRVLAFRQND